MAAFNADFWIASVTSAPVLALASVVISADVLGSGHRFLRRGWRDSTSRRRNVRRALVSYFASAANTLLQATAFFVGMISLSERHDSLPRVVVVLGQAAGFTLLIFASIQNAVAQDAAYRAEEARATSGLD